MKITEASHLDHALTPDHLAWLLRQFGERDAFFTATVEIPPDLPALPCTLHGPLMGDATVPDAECRLKVRGTRSGPSRLCDRPPRLVRQVTVIAGPHEGEPCVLYTAFGGPLAPREPWDPSLNDAGRAESEAFWREHALSR